MADLAGFEQVYAENIWFFKAPKSDARRRLALIRAQHAAKSTIRAKCTYTTVVIVSSD